MVGAEYTPWRAPNELWWHEYHNYRADVIREIKFAKEVMGFTTLRIFLHSMLYADNAEKLKTNMADFLDICGQEGFTAGFVFFDDCWNHAGADLREQCVPKKGLHNGCWMASPQDIERTNVDRFKPYVTDIVNTFKEDKRVAWWEIFNEPQRNNTFTMSLRHAGFGWAKAQNPTQPVISCWDDSEDTEIVDHHQYFNQWGVNNPVFFNPAKGGIVTEAGARWYQKTAHDAGSPLMVLNWLTALKDSGSAPFIPGVMIAWEVMVGHSQTRWHWSDKEGSAEPPIPWCNHIYPDGTPVSFTEAAATRRNITGKDDFLYVETFLDDTPGSLEKYLVLPPGQSFKSASVDATEALYELTFWPENVSDELSFKMGGSYTVSIDGYHLTLDGPDGQLASFDVMKVEGGVVLKSWNMLRVLVQNGRVRVWFNPQFSDVTGASVPPADEVSTTAMPPRIDVATTGKATGGDFVISTRRKNRGNFRVDYVSVLPPKLYGLAAEKPDFQITI
eukprot:TRINITY_DN15577_c0_g2_i1.p1 TRINITY_DN15577_c0_g2~~TRINITY_DN15577_c0_g2_i1.p1  ORF type:complete len:560 (-),score=80.06 TRINITY_DN15577_c0_g2_i1:8-1513(-)